MTLGPTIVRNLADRGFLILDRMGALGALDRSRSDKLTVLMYHGIIRSGSSRIGSPAVDAETLACQVAYLKRHFLLVHPGELWCARSDTFSSTQPRVALTFDDGFGNNATQAMPILEDMQAPALFFVSTRHIVATKYLWFAHALALFALHPGAEVELLGRSWKLGGQSLRRRHFWEFVELSRKVSASRVYSELEQYPVESFVPPEVIEDELRGMTATEIKGAAGSRLFEIGAHTRDHPLLTTCSDEELDVQVVHGRQDIERICGTPPVAFAYPEGDHDARVIEHVKLAGFRTAYVAGRSRQANGGSFEIPRIGVYSDAMGLFAAKARGLVRG